ncbi:MAG: TolC family protein [Prevotellaceae bacterium]|nr:TolC family protein [Prevotellaceae bacterium]
MKRRKAKNRVIAAALMFLALVVLLPVAAQPPANEANLPRNGVWTLEQCINHAVKSNISIQQLKINSANAEIDLNSAKNSRLPDLNAGMGQNFNFGRTQTQTGLYENSTQSNSSLSVSSSVPIFTGFRIKNEIARSRFELMAAVESLEKAKENLAINVASLYLQVLLNKELLKVAEEQLKLTALMLEKTKIMLEADKIPASQLAEMEARAAREEAQIVQAKNSVAIALLDLVQSLELETVEGFDVETPAADAEVENRSMTPSPNEVYANALTTKPAVREQEYRIESAIKSLEIARAGLMPSLSLSMGYGTNYFYMYRRNANNISIGNQLRNNGGEYVGLSLNIPIFNRFAVRNRMKSARLNIDNQRLSLEAVKKTLYKEIQTASLNVTASMEKYRASGKAVEAATLSLQFVSEKYDNGKATVYEFNESKTALTQASLEQIQAKYDYIFRRKILDFYNGELTFD